MANSLFINPPTTGLFGTRDPVQALSEELNPHATCGVWSRQHESNGISVRNVPLTLSLWQNPFLGKVDYCVLPYPSNYPNIVYTLVPSAGYVMRRPSNLIYDYVGDDAPHDTTPLAIQASQGFVKLHIQIVEHQIVNRNALESVNYAIWFRDEANNRTRTLWFGDSAQQTISSTVVFEAQLYFNLESKYRLVIPYFFSAGSDGIGRPVFRVPVLVGTRSQVTPMLYDAYSVFSSRDVENPMAIVPLNYGEQALQVNSINDDFYRCWLTVLKDGFSQNTADDGQSVGAYVAF